MNQNIHKTASNVEAFTNTNLNDYAQENILARCDAAQKDEEFQQQARYLNRVLEAYGDCV